MSGELFDRGLPPAPEAPPAIEEALIHAAGVTISRLRQAAPRPLETEER
jgi:hypothetical protein